ncbi:RGS1-HXK1-interacting protein 1 isoform X1 [Typha angustifolia]|uniref:RGS1-HXK1-interacting protein 1 isoform X1 n=1 Tax=Typha angustifolia TaxID=59011 RepID=UPI003C2D8024
MMAGASSNFTPNPSSSPLPSSGQEGRQKSWIALRSARSPQEDASWLLQKLQNLVPTVRSQYRVYEDAVVEKVKDKILLACEHPVEACGFAVGAGIILMRGPRRFLLRHTLGRFKTEKQLLSEAESSLKEFTDSVEMLKKHGKNARVRAGFAEEHLQRGLTNMRSSGLEIQRLVNSIYKVESTSADLMHQLRTIPGRKSLELRAEVASMASELKDQRRKLEKKLVGLSELGIRV